MMLMLLLAELTRLQVQLTVEPDGLKVDAPAGALSDELRQAMTEHKAALLRYAACPSWRPLMAAGRSPALAGKRTRFATACSMESGCATRLACGLCRMASNASTCLGPSGRLSAWNVKHCLSKAPIGAPFPLTVFTSSSNKQFQ